MLSKKMIAVFVALAFLVLPFVLIDNVDGATSLRFDSGSMNVGSFNERSNGTISITLENITTAEITDVSVYVTYLHETGKLAEVTGISIPAGVDTDNPGKRTIDLSFRISSPGTHYVEVFVEPRDRFVASGSGDSTTYANSSGSIEVHVASSIWSNTSTYIVIVLVIVVIGVAIWLKMRNNPSSKKETTTGTFTAMEAQKKASKEKKYEKAEEKAMLEAAPEDLMENEPEVAPPHSSTEKKEYTGKVSSTKKKQTSTQRKSNPSNRKSSKRK